MKYGSKIKIIFFLLLLLLGCTLESKKMNITIKNNYEDKIIFDYNDIEYSINENVEILIALNTEAKFLSFDLEMNTDKLKLEKVETYNFTKDESIVLSKRKDGRDHFIFCDLKRALNSQKQAFAKLKYKVRWVGDENITVSNLTYEK